MKMFFSSGAQRGRPKSLAVLTPTKLISLEQAREQLMGQKAPQQTYIEVGGGPASLPQDYHTVIELPSKYVKQIRVHMLCYNVMHNERVHCICSKSACWCTTL